MRVLVAEHRRAGDRRAADRQSGLCGAAACKFGEPLADVCAHRCDLIGSRRVVVQEPLGVADHADLRGRV